MGFYSKIGNIQAVLWCSIGSSLIGLIVMIVGAIMTGVAYTEITPPDFDENYQRYKGAHFMRITGPLSLVFGLILLFGSCCFFIVAFISQRNAEYSGHSSRYDYNTKQAMDTNSQEDLERT